MFCLERFSGYNKNLHCRKMYPQHLSLSFHQISCRRCACGRACAGGEVIKLLAWGSVQHSQTTLMPCAAICQNELWSRILLIISQVGKKKEVTDLSCFYLSISVLLSSLMCCFYSWDEQDLKGRDWFGNWAFTSIHESFFKKKNKEKICQWLKLFSNSISQQMVSVSHSVCFCSYQASVVFLKHFSVKYAKFPHRQTAPSQLQGFDK